VTLFTLTASGMLKNENKKEEEEEGEEDDEVKPKKEKKRKQPEKNTSNEEYSMSRGIDFKGDIYALYILTR
jgi:hypothetical protein